MSKRLGSVIAVLVSLCCLAAAFSGDRPWLPHSARRVHTSWFLPCPPCPCPPVICECVEVLDICPRECPPEPADICPPVVALQLLAPARVSAGQEIDYSIIVQNTSTEAAHHVLLRNPLPVNARYVRANPQPNAVEPDLQWRLGTLEGGQRREIKLVLAPTAPGDVINCALVNYEHGLCVTTRFGQTVPLPEGSGVRNHGSVVRSQKSEVRGQRSEVRGHHSTLASHHLPLTSDGAPVVALRLLAPSQAGAGQDVEYRLLVENRSGVPAHSVLVRNPLPVGVRVARMQPQPSAVEPELQWRLGTLAPGAKHEITFALAANAAELNNCARVSLEHGLCVTTTISQPALRIRKAGPAEAQLNDVLTYQLTVTNTGDGAATNVVITDNLPQGLEHDSGHRQLRFSIGTLGPGESKTVSYRVTAKAQGRLCNQAVVTADGGLRDEVESCVAVTEARLDLAKTGPKQVYIGATIQYKLTVSNSGTGIVRNLVLADRLPAQTSFVSASDGGRLVGSEVQWVLGNLGPGGSKTVELTVKAQSPGEAVNRAQATADRGLRVTAEVKTEILGASGLLLEVVDADDPVEVGADTHYNIIIRNQGSIAATNVRIVATVPPQVTVIRVQGPVDHTKEGQKVTYQPLSIPPNSDAIYRVYVRGLKPGDIRFRVELTADQLPTGAVLEEESTNVYSDINGGKPE